MRWLTEQLHREAKQLSKTKAYHKQRLLDDYMRYEMAHLLCTLRKF